MKTILRTSLGLMIAILVIITAYSCKKKKSDEASRYRITQFLNYRNGTLNGKSLIEYSGDLISMMRYYNLDTLSGILVENETAQVDYPDDNTVSLVYSGISYYTGLWETNSKEVLTFSGGLLMESMSYDYYNTTWQPYSKFDRTYSNQQLIQTINYHYNYGTWEYDRREDFQYDGSKLIQAINYDYNAGWVPMYKAIINYNGNHIDNILYSYYDGSVYNPYYKMVYEYSNDYISNITEYSYSGGIWTVYYSTSYSYDGSGNLTSEVENYNTTEYKTVCSYQGGSGNWRELAEGGYYSDFFYFHVTPMPTKGKPVNPFVRLDQKAKNKM